MRLLRNVLLLVVALLIATPLMAADGKKRGNRPRGRGFDAFAVYERLNLTEDQKTKLADIKKECEPKLKEAREKMTGILSKEQREAGEKAFTEARAAGKSREETRKAVEEAQKVTDDQKKQLADARAAGEKLRAEVREKVKAILTDEQKKQLDDMAAKRGGKKRGGN